MAAAASVRIAMATSLALYVIAVALLPVAQGHGYLIEPPSRSSLWRLGYDAPPNYNDNALRCGGSRTQCAVCGDPINGPRDNQAGGKYATGLIARHYTYGQVIGVTVVVTANHGGFFEFNLCPHNDVTTAVTEECMMGNVLAAEDGRKRFQLSASQYGRIHFRLRLPVDVTCAQCVLRWRWTAGNSWGVDEKTGRGCVGCGPQERFYGCADIGINAVGEESTHNTHQTPSPQKRPTPHNVIPTQTPTSSKGSSRLICKAINNWAGDPDLDKWCDVSCNVVDYCPGVYCLCRN